MVGQYDERKTKNAVIVSSKKIIPNKEFTYCNAKSDIALIQLSEDVLSLDVKAGSGTMFNFIFSRAMIEIILFNDK